MASDASKRTCPWCKGRKTVKLPSGKTVNCNRCGGTGVSEQKSFSKTPNVTQK